MRRVFEQKGHTVTAADCSGPGTHQMHDLRGSGQWQRDTDTERLLIVSGNRLISKMLTVPVERPNCLEPFQHIEIAGVPMKGGPIDSSTPCTTIGSSPQIARARSSLSGTRSIEGISPSRRARHSNSGVISTNRATLADRGRPGASRCKETQFRELWRRPHPRTMPSGARTRRKASLDRDINGAGVHLRTVGTPAQCRKSDSTCR